MPDLTEKYYLLELQHWDLEKPLQCSKCCKLGHSSKYCSSSELGCPRCLGNHSLSIESIYIEVPKCTNCDGSQQSTDYNLCPKYVQWAKVLRIVHQENAPFPIAAMELAKLSEVPSVQDLMRLRK